MANLIIKQVCSYYIHGKGIPCFANSCSFISGNQSISDSVCRFQEHITKDHQFNGNYNLIFDKDEKTSNFCMPNVH